MLVAEFLLLYTVYQSEDIMLEFALEWWGIVGELAARRRLLMILVSHLPAWMVVVLSMRCADLSCNYDGVLDDYNIFSLRKWILQVYLACRRHVYQCATYCNC